MKRGHHPGNVYYRQYGIEHSIPGMAKAVLTRLPSVLNALRVRGFWPSSFQGGLTTLPADLLIDERGVIRVAYYGRDSGDHLPFEHVRAFSREAHS